MGPQLHTGRRHCRPPGLGSSGDSSSAPRVVNPSEEVLTSYRAFRRMHAKSEKFNQEGWLDAWTEMDANGFRYTIVSERGSDYVRNKVLKAVLQREQEIVAGGADKAALTEENYTFSEGESEPGLRYVLLKPKRKDVMLVEGRMVLNADSGDLLRVEGKLSKNPSFWTSLVNVIRHFAEARWRPRAGIDRVGRQGEVRRPVAPRRVLRVRVDQRPPGQRRGASDARIGRRRQPLIPVVFTSATDRHWRAGTWRASAPRDSPAAAPASSSHQSQSPVRGFFRTPRGPLPAPTRWTPA